MTHLPRLLNPLLLAAALLSSCSVLQQQNKDRQQEEERKTPTPLYMGEVHQVYPSQNFALLRIIARPLPQAGETLITHPADGSTARMGNLVVSPDTSPNHDMIAADIRSGTVASGDLVFLYRNIAPPEENNNSPAADTPVPGDAADTGTTPGVRVHATRADLPAEKPATAAAAAPAATPTTEEDAPPAAATSPGLPTQPIILPGQSETAPSYLNNIPDNVNEWH